MGCRPPYKAVFTCINSAALMSLPRSMAATSIYGTFKTKMQYWHQHHRPRTRLAHHESHDHDHTGIVENPHPQTVASSLGPTLVSHK